MFIQSYLVFNNLLKQLPHKYFTVSWNILVRCSSNFKNVFTNFHITFFNI